MITGMTIFILLSCILLLPLRFHLYFKKNKETEIGLAWLRLHPFKRNSGQMTEAVRRRKGGITGPLGSPLHVAWRFRPLLASGLGSPGREFLKSFFNCIDVKTGRMTVVVGFSDPAETGRVFGLLQALQHTFRQKSILIVPDFSGRVFQADGSLVITTSLARLLRPGCCFLINPKVRRAIWDCAFPPKRDRSKL